MRISTIMDLNLNPLLLKPTQEITLGLQFSTTTLTRKSLTLRLKSKLTVLTMLLCNKDKINMIFINKWLELRVKCHLLKMRLLKLMQANTLSKPPSTNSTAFPKPANTTTPGKPNPSFSHT